MPKIIAVFDVPESDPKFDDPEVLMEVVMDWYHDGREEGEPEMKLESAKWEPTDG